MSSHPESYEASSSNARSSSHALSTEMSGLQLDDPVSTPSRPRPLASNSGARRDNASSKQADHKAGDAPAAWRNNYLPLHPPGRQYGSPRSSSPMMSPSRSGTASPRSGGAPKSATLGQHMYSSGFLHGSLSDVNIQAFDRIYRLHRIVLCQSPFFESMLLGGFSEQGESDAAAFSVPGQGKPFHLQFERNISRAAFEYCLSRLYGGGPTLSLPAWADTSVHPLSKPFAGVLLNLKEQQRKKSVAQPATADLLTSACPSTHDGIAGDQELQTATPRFLLSLLITATYLELADIANQVSQLIHSSITPYTVTTYLDFALGKGITGWSEKERMAHCNGLESIATPVERFNPAAQRQSHFSAEAASDGGNYYGNVCERIGEACANYLAKFGISHILPVEEAQATDGIQRNIIIQASVRVWQYGGIPADWMRGVLSSDALFLGSATEGQCAEWDRYQAAKRVVELRRSSRIASEQAKMAEGKVRKGKGRAQQPELNIDESTVIPDEEKDSSPPERGSASESLLDGDEEAEFEELFETGIYYSHLTFEQLLSLQQDISPTTGTCYAPIHVLQAAHWTASCFSSSIPGGSDSRIVKSPLDISIALSKVSSGGLSQSASTANSPYLGTLTSLVLSNMIGPNLLHRHGHRYFQVPSDSTFRSNEEGPVVNNLLSPLATSPANSTILYQSANQTAFSENPHHRDNPDDTSPTPPSGAERFFSLTSIQSKFGVACEKHDDPSLRRWTKFEPCRVSLEWYINEEMQDKQRLYSKTWAYGGSYWNCYLQVVKKKGPQIGCYLHRQSMLEPIPVASQPPYPPPTSDTGARALIDPYSADTLYSSSGSPPSIPNLASLRRQTSPISGFSSRAGSDKASNMHDTTGSLRSSSSFMGSAATYVDQRKTVACHFSIHIFNLAGNALATFTSEPSEFAISQSWGYKSGKLLTEEYLGSACDKLLGTWEGEMASGASAFESLKATVTMGLV